MLDLTGVQRDALRRMLRNARPWCLAAQTRSVLLRHKLVKASNKKCKEHGRVRMVELTPEGRVEAKK